MAHLQADLDAKAHDAKRGHGLRMLRQIWARMAKGESGYRLELWKQQKKRAEYARLHEIERHLRHVSQDPDKQMAVRILRQQAALTLRGEIGMRVEIWRWGHDTIKRRKEAAGLRRQPAAKLKNLRSIIDSTVGRLKKENLLNHCPELKLAVEHEEMRNNALNVGCKMLYIVMVKIVHDLDYSIPIRWWRSNMRLEKKDLRYV